MIQQAIETEPKHPPSLLLCHQTHIKRYRVSKNPYEILKEILRNFSFHDCSLSLFRKRADSLYKQLKRNTRSKQPNGHEEEYDQLPPFSLKSYNRRIATVTKPDLNDCLPSSEPTLGRKSCFCPQPLLSKPETSDAQPRVTCSRQSQEYIT